MSNNILRPGYTIDIIFDPQMDPNAVLRVLCLHTDALRAALKQPLAQLFMEYFTTFLDSFVKNLGHEHDGYESKWEHGPSVDLDWDKNSDPAAAIELGIQVRCKEEDFSFFKQVLQGDQFVDLYGQAIMAVLVHHLESGGIKVVEDNVRFTEWEFG